MYDKTCPTPSGDDRSDNASSELKGHANVYSTIDGPTNTYPSPEGPTEDYSELSHPAKAITRPGNELKFNSNYSKLNGHTADEELPTCDVSIHGHPQTQPQILPPHVAALYDTANYPSKPTRQHDYAETADFIGLPSDSFNSVIIIMFQRYPFSYSSPTNQIFTCRPALAIVFPFGWYLRASPSHTLRYPLLAWSHCSY